MLQVKGSILKGAVETTKEIYGEKEYDRLVNLIDKKERGIFQNPISTSGWYSLDAYTQFLDVVLREKLGGNPMALIKSTGKVTEKHLRGIYSAFVKKGSPEFLMEKISALHALLLRGVTIESSIIAPGKFKIRYVGFEKKHAVYEHSLIGFYHKAAEVYGAKNVKVEFITRISEAKGYAEIVITWNK